MEPPLIIACVIIAGAKRRDLLDTKILPGIIQQDFDSVIVVGEHYPGDGYTYLHVPDMMKNTNDALVKRDVGSLATNADILCYLSDDHALHWDFVNQLRQCANNWDVLVPSRWAVHPQLGRIRIPMGDTEGYMGGHGGVFKRWVIQARPWTTMPHDRCWDVLASKVQQELGTRWVVAPQLEIEDLEVERCPWR